jgi:Nucleotide modification associated domain 3
LKIIFSRKGFDSGAGGAPSPIIDGRPISLPIPTQRRSETTYRDLRLENIVESVTKGRLTGANLCHHDPMFERGRCAFGQTGAAQTHLKNNGVGVGDVFLFFGLFCNPDGSDRHHRIFGSLVVEEVIVLGPQPEATSQPAGFSQRHPHTVGEWNPNNTLYLGHGQVAAVANEELRLSRVGGPVSRWRVPPWLRNAGLTYHGKEDRWDRDDTLTVAARGQEFVSDVSRFPGANKWLEGLLSMLARDVPIGAAAHG